MNLENNIWRRRGLIHDDDVKDDDNDDDDNDDNEDVR
jgi:hypothetical protein